MIWHRTGDAGYLDSVGRLWLLGRAEARITDARGTLDPFAVECAASRIEGVRRSALVHDQAKRLLVVELERSATPSGATSIPSNLAWAGLDDVLIVPAIPLDKRHNAKVDYPALRRLLKRRRGWRRWFFMR
jgi:acyl-coenzyme A synthetase/AMP-(fatty) acid ligase